MPQHQIAQKAKTIAGQSDHSRSSEVYEPLPPGYLLRELGYFDEIEAAAAIDITPKNRWAATDSKALAQATPW
jgi:hypothetical protein